MHGTINIKYVDYVCALVVFVSFSDMEFALESSSTRTQNQTGTERNNSLTDLIQT